MRILMVSDVYFPRVNGVSTSIETFRRTLAELGIPSEDAYISRYCERTGIASPEQLKADWNFYLAYNMFRLAAILQGIAKRVEAGTASNEQAVKSAAGARPLAEMAWGFASAR